MKNILIKQSLISDTLISAVTPAQVIQAAINRHKVEFNSNSDLADAIAQYLVFAMRTGEQRDKRLITRDANELTLTFVIK